MNLAPRSRQHHDLYSNYQCQDSEISGLLGECGIVHQNWRNAQLEEKSGDLAEMSRILGEMLKYASGSHKSELTELKSKIDQKRNGKKLKWAVYVAIVGIVIFFMAQEGLNGAPNNSSDRPSTPSFSSNTSNTPTNRNVPSSNSSSPSTSTVNITPTDPYRETMPPAAQGRSLSVDQVRYCIFQGERLDYMRPLAISNVQMTRFNGLIDDYNSRCSNFQYRAGVLERVRREAASRNSQLRADAQRIVASWSGTRDQSSAVSPMSESGPTFRRYTSTDLFGGDLTQNGYRGVSILECEAICARDSKCAGYTHVHDRNWCWPKSSIAQPRSGKIGLTSAIKTY